MKYTHTDILDIILDLLQLYKLYTARGEQANLEPVLRKLDDVIAAIQAQGTVDPVIARLDQLIQEVRGLQIRVPGMVETRGWLEEAEPYYRDGSGTASSTGVVYEEVLPYPVRVVSFLVNVGDGGAIQLRKNGIPVFPKDTLITTTGTWLSINPPTKLATFEPGSRLQVYVKVNSGTPTYKWIIVGAVTQPPTI